MTSRGPRIRNSIGGIPLARTVARLSSHGNVLPPIP